MSNCCRLMSLGIQNTRKWKRNLKRRINIQHFSLSKKNQLDGLIYNFIFTVLLDKRLLCVGCFNSAYVLMTSVFLGVIALTEELLLTAKQNEDFASVINMGVSTSDGQQNSNRTSQYDLDSMLNQHDRYPVGTKIQAVWSEDGEWYDATIDAITPIGYQVSFSEWGNKEEVDPANVRLVEEEGAVVNALVEAEKEAEATKQALKRKIAQAAASDYQSKTIPAKLRVNPDDPDDVKVAKRKKLHAFKSKMRFEQLEVTQNKRQNAWQQFQTTKGRAKKVGFFSGRKKESIFKSPEDPFGKVGVTGSGKGLTDFQRREKHLHLKGENIDNDNTED